MTIFVDKPGDLLGEAFEWEGQTAAAVSAWPQLVARAHLECVPNIDYLLSHGRRCGLFGWTNVWRSLSYGQVSGALVMQPFECANLNIRFAANHLEALIRDRFISQTNWVV